MEKVLTTTTTEEILEMPRQVILLVDDNEDILDFVSDDLSEKYEVLTATNGVEALALLQTEIVHLVVSDVMMPEMDGFELCDRIKSELEFSHIPVVLLTAKNSMQSKIEGLEMGADAYVEKPFSPEFLQVQIASLLKNRSKIQAYYSSSPLIHMKSMAYSKADESFLGKLNDTIYKNLDNPDLDVDHLADHMNISRPTLYRKIKSISDLSPNELINLARLKKAAELLNEGMLKIYEISEMVGYSSQSHFGRNFAKQFGMSPTDYLNSRLLDKRK
ncbi:putative two-component system sensor kinase/response regulator fusion protein [Pedobacter sp. BAL39]|uniref:response regulator transcription factor n=1 Tax=Pedobacter sp. BAL39 TaxID=391596 RepID=UPI000155A150|nr:response regulator [Pedobacter sp. BAL39]EDM35337.1 putative two-component system sensor kinase/response regulator fusion protein [Pedobacter sp. BAL39]